MHVNKIKGWFNWWKYLTILNNSFFDGESWKRPRWKSSDLAFSWKLIYLAPSPLRPLYLRLTCHAEASAKAKASEKVSLVGIPAQYNLLHVTTPKYGTMSLKLHLFSTQYLLEFLVCSSILSSFCVLPSICELLYLKTLSTYLVHL